MKITKDSKIAVDVRECTVEEKQHLWHKLRAIVGKTKVSYPRDAQVAYIDTNTTSQPHIGWGRDAADDRDYYSDQGITILSYQEAMRALRGEAEKPDAYIDSEHIIHIRHHANLHTVDYHPSNAWKYNLMSEEEFKAKYDEKPKLKFKEWDVEVTKDTIVTGCEGHHKIYPKTAIENFMKFGQIVPNDGPSLDEIYDFVRIHKKELGLAF